MNARLGRHRAKLNTLGPGVKRLTMDQVALGQGMDILETRVCRCGDDSGDVVSEDGGSSYIPFPGRSPSVPLPIPPPVPSSSATAVPLLPLGSSSSDKENSSPGSFKSAQQGDGLMVEIQEEGDPKVDSDAARELSDAMDRKVRSRLNQRCKSKKHPLRFAPFSEGWKADRACRERQQTFHPKVGAELKRIVRTRNLREGLLGDADDEGEHPQDGDW